MIWQKEIRLSERSRGFHLITSEILKELPQLPEKGLLNIFLQHTSAGLSLNENADPSVRLDLNRSFDQVIKERESWYTHTYEGDDDMPAHIKSTLVGASLMIPIQAFKPALGTWQGIYLCEFRNYGGSRKLLITIYS